MDYKSIIDSIHASLNNDNIEPAIRNCLRLARLSKDLIFTGVFLRHLCRDSREFVSAIFEEVQDLSEDQQKTFNDIVGKRWLEVRSFPQPILTSLEGDSLNCVTLPAGLLDAQILQSKQEIADLVVPPGMHPYDIAAFTDSFDAKKARLRTLLAAYETVKARLKTLCTSYASRFEQQLESQQQTRDFLYDILNQVNNFFKARSDLIYQKLQKASGLSGSTDPEDAAFLLTEVRRALKEVADLVYPSKKGNVRCLDGKERDLSEEKYLNRLREFLAQCSPSSTSKELLRAELDQLGLYVEKINALASKGVHTAVSLEEAKQGLVGLYFFLFNIMEYIPHS